MQIPKIPVQRKFVSTGCYARSNAQNCGSFSFDAIIKILTEIVCSAYFNAHKPPTNFKKSKTWTPVTPTIFMLDTKF